MRVGVTRGALLVVVAMSAAACAVGTATLRIAEAEAEIVRVAEIMTDAVGLDVAGPVVSAPLEQCTLRSGAPGLRTRVALRAPLPATPPATPSATLPGMPPDMPDALARALDTAANVLVEQGLVVVESGVPGTLLGQRDGITVTVGGDATTFEFDALTGCRPR